MYVLELIILKSQKRYKNNLVVNDSLQYPGWPPIWVTQWEGAWTLQGVKRTLQSVPQGHRPMLAPMLPRVMSSWLDVHWVVDGIFTGICWVCKTQQHCSSWHKPVRRAPTTKPRSKALKSFVLPVHPSEWHIYTIHVSRLENPYLICLLPFIYTDWSEFNKWHQ
jgi:hypothetical protein